MGVTRPTTQTHQNPYFLTEFLKMPNSQPPPSPKRKQRSRAGTLKRQARRREKRRAKIMAGLTDPFAAAMIVHTFIGESEDDVPLALVPSCRLRQHVRKLNTRVDQLVGSSPAPENLGCPEPLPANLNLDAVVDVVPARRTPRKYNRASSVSPFPLLPMMPEQQKTLAFILRGAREYPEETGLGRRHRCPSCSRSSDPAADGWRSLSVYPTAAGELVFRCHRCGFCLDSVEFVQRTTYGFTLAQAARFLADCRQLTTPLSTGQIAAYERLAELRALFERGRSNFRRHVAEGNRVYLFGDWALLSVPRLRRIFPDLDPRGRLPADCLVRVSHDVFGRWSALHLHQPRSYSPLYRLELRDWEAPAPLTVFLPQWADYLEHQQLVLCAESAVAMGMEQAVRHWSDGERLPVALIDRCTGTSNEPVLPFSTVWAVPRGSRSARFALPWCASTSIPGEPKVLVRRLPDDISRAETPPSFCASRVLFCNPAAPECVDDLASMIVAEREHQPLAVAMADVLGQPGLSVDTRRRLVDKVCSGAGVAPEMLVPDGFNPWTGGPHALNAAGVTYIAREGQYWKRGRREKEFTPVTNFVLHLSGHEVGAKGKVTHKARLEIGGKNVELTLSSAVLGNTKRLLAALVDAAVLAGAELPVISDAKAKRLLPELVKSTQCQIIPPSK